MSQSEIARFSARPTYVPSTTYAPLISVSYITFVAHIGKGTWTDRTSQRATGWPDLATEPGWRNETGNRGGKREKEREACGEKVWTLKTNLSRSGEEEEEGGSKDAVKAPSGLLSFTRSISLATMVLGT